MGGNVYAYARVSSKDQNEARQIEAFKETGVDVKNIYLDKQSGKDFNRPKYMSLFRKLKKGDCLYILSLDRLGRNYDEIQRQWQLLTKEKGVDIVVMDMPLLDTRQEKNLLGTFISDLVLQILAFVAENERTYIRKRQAEGIAIAKANGVKFGRPKMDLPNNFEEVAKRYQKQEITVREGAELCGMTISTFYNKANEMIKEMTQFKQTIIRCPKCGREAGKLSRTRAFCSECLQEFKYEAPKESIFELDEHRRGICSKCGRFRYIQHKGLHLCKSCSQKR